ncbi:ATP-binding protein [Stratiformator vulcanicus]|uniref:AAA-like domain protein n=1 Tax=Stratiformator vulcanicus TaxID=2527980 RepID=A0A517QZY1_9PLAN|nr:DUF87 domain-containing protein [Stratiformator vulcanicus]QDT37124.1 AAA-like domain protein [Stratiformator vulcanicus]
MNYEKLGAFYLGKRYDLAEREVTDELYLYDSKDLTTHALCVGMTGSGKTGLCLSLIEEAAIDHVPVIAIDPKGDLGNLMLTFPDLKADDFRPWVDERAALNKGRTADQAAADAAKLWKQGLAAWDQTPERIAKFKESAEVSIYTPGSNAGIPLTVLKSFSAPAQEVIDDAETFRERVSSSTSGLLSLLGIKADPVRSREHILLSNILDTSWRAGTDLSIGGLIHAIQEPPFEKVGVLDLETFYPLKDRTELAMTVNNLLASPTFAGWMEGEPLDVQSLMFTSEGQPRISILSIAHLSEDERMFFVTILLGEILSWTRSQAGTSSLRAILYMDEVYGFFPPVANPPSKQPMLTLLKQARAYGLGCVLATQNPVDLDYKGLSNIGTWFLGRLQTERDKARVLEGLEGASTQAGTTFDRAEMEATLAALGGRVFLANNVHEDKPVIFQTRWALSYLRGPLTRRQIETLMADQKAEAIATADEEHSPEELKSDEAGAKPVVPKQIRQYVLPVRGEISGVIVYRPALLGRARMHFARVSYGVDVTRDIAMLVPIRNSVPVHVWDETLSIDPAELGDIVNALPDASFSEPAPALLRPKSYETWEKKLKDHLYRSERVIVLKSKSPKLYSEADETEGAFRARLSHLLREERDLEKEKLRNTYARKANTINGRLESARAAVDRERDQANRATMSAAMSFGSTILGALFGRKLASRSNVTKATSSMKSVGRAADQRADIGEAQKKVERYEAELQELDAELRAELEAIEEEFDPNAIEFEELTVKPKKTDIECVPVALVWTPWVRDADGMVEPAFDSE